QSDRATSRLLAGGGAAGGAPALVAVTAMSAARTPAPEPADAVAMAMRPACTDTARKLVDAAIFLRADATDQQRADLDQLLKTDSRVREVRYESRQAAYEKFKQMYRDAPDLVAAVKLEQLPETFRVKLAEPSGYATFITDIEGQPGVETALVGECPEGAK
ncbi:permease-like cell division protein FtsX, partial [Micromonospora sp. CPCC 205371]|nr:permease-like cell division protein FtsX [Micromonospora sp. CPCC 205371]